MGLIIYNQLGVFITWRQQPMRLRDKLEIRALVNLIISVIERLSAVVLKLTSNKSKEK